MMCTQQTLWLERLCKRRLYVRCTRLHIGDEEGEPTDCLQVLCVEERKEGSGCLVEDRLARCGRELCI